MGQTFPVSLFGPWKGGWHIDDYKVVFDDRGCVETRRFNYYITICVIQFRLISDLERKEIAFLLFAALSMIGASGISVMRICKTPAGDSEMVFSIMLLVNLGMILASSYEWMNKWMNEIYKGVLFTENLSTFWRHEKTWKFNLSWWESQNVSLIDTIWVLTLFYAPHQFQDPRLPS